MNKNKANAVIGAAQRHLFGIETAKDLSRERLTLAEYQAAMELMQELSVPNSEAKTFMSGAANFFKRFGFSVTSDGVNFIVSTR